MQRAGDPGAGERLKSPNSSRSDIRPGIVLGQADLVAAGLGEAKVSHLEVEGRQISLGRWLTRRRPSGLEGWVIAHAGKGSDLPVRRPPLAFTHGGGLFALLDDIAVLAKAAAPRSTTSARPQAGPAPKAAGVIVDDTAVTRDTSRAWTPSASCRSSKIAIGSLRNKLLFILPAALLLSQFLPWALTPC